MITRPEPTNYDFYQHINDPEYDPDDWDEEVYRDDLAKWMDHLGMAYTD